MCRVCNPPYCRGKSTIVYVSVVFEQAYTTMGRRQWQPTPVLMPGKFLQRRSLVGCGPWGHEQSDTTEQLHFYLSRSCIGEGNVTPLQCSCLENPRCRGPALADPGYLKKRQHRRPIYLFIQRYKE